MAAVSRGVVIAAPAAAAWDAVRDVGAIHTRLAPGFVTGTTLEDGGFRVVTFADGLVLRERIVAVDDDARRLVWSGVAGPFEHHNASVQVTDDDRGCRLAWTADLLPDALAGTVAGIMERCLGLTKRTLEARDAGAGSAAAASDGAAATVPAAGLFAPAGVT